MATLDQKSPNVLLQSLCCRITGKSEGTPGNAGTLRASCVQCEIQTNRHSNKSVLKRLSSQFKSPTRHLICKGLWLIVAVYWSFRRVFPASVSPTFINNWTLSLPSLAQAAMFLLRSVVETDGTFVRMNAPCFCWKNAESNTQYCFFL